MFVRKSPQSLLMTSAYSLRRLWNETGRVRNLVVPAPLNRPPNRSIGYQLSTVCPDSESAATNSPFWICSSASPMSKFLPPFNSTAQAKLMPCHSPNAMRSQSLCRKRCCLWYREPSSMTRDAESKPRRFKRHPRSPVDCVTQHFEWRLRICSRISSCVTVLRGSVGPREIPHKESRLPQ